MKEILLGVWIPLSVLMGLLWFAVGDDEFLNTFCGVYFLCSFAVLLFAIF